MFAELHRFDRTKVYHMIPDSRELRKSSSTRPAWPSEPWMIDADETSNRLPGELRWSGCDRSGDNGKDQTCEARVGEKRNRYCSMGRINFDGRRCSDALHGLYQQTFGSALAISSTSNCSKRILPECGLYYRPRTSRRMILYGILSWNRTGYD